MVETCHECHTVIDRLNIEFNELYNKYELLKDKRYDEIINELYFRLDVIQNQNSEMDLEDIDKYCEIDENYNLKYFNVIEYFKNEYNINEFDNLMILFKKLSEKNLKKTKEVYKIHDEYIPLIYSKMDINMEEKKIECLIDLEYSHRNYDICDIITCDDIQDYDTIKQRICPTWFKRIDECECSNCQMLCDGFG
tara:strand:- start:1222 stop:1803 length:582 start_codon:yes stop_codon:yes gene_type:complete